MPPCPWATDVFPCIAKKMISCLSFAPSGRYLLAVQHQAGACSIRPDANTNPPHPCASQLLHLPSGYFTQSGSMAGILRPAMHTLYASTHARNARQKKTGGCTLTKVAKRRISAGLDDVVLGKRSEALCRSRSSCGAQDRVCVMMQVEQWSLVLV